jgi:hypothetical protein
VGGRPRSVKLWEEESPDSAEQGDGAQALTGNRWWSDEEICWTQIRN